MAVRNYIEWQTLWLERARKDTIPWMSKTSRRSRISSRMSESRFVFVTSWICYNPPTRRKKASEKVTSVSEIIIERFRRWRFSSTINSRKIQLPVTLLRRCYKTCPIYLEDGSFIYEKPQFMNVESRIAEGRTAFHHLIRDSYRGQFDKRGGNFINGVRSRTFIESTEFHRCQRF